MDIDFIIEGKLFRDLTVITGNDMITYLQTKGYGETHKKKFVLRPFESLYLLYHNKLKLTQRNKIISFNSFVDRSIKYDNSLLTKFLIYNDLRTKGYVVKDGFGFGYDFRVYERGKSEENGTKYLIFGFDEGKQEKIHTLQKKIDNIIKMGKEPIVAVIERRGEIIYYKITKMNFLKNTKT